MADPLRVACLISGGGTTMRAILDAIRVGTLQRVTVPLIIASKAGVKGIERAKEFGLHEGTNILVLDPDDGYKDRQEAFAKAILFACKHHNINVIGQYGWMPLTPPSVIAEFKGWMINQHPGPIDPGRPGFGGKGMFGIRVHFARLFFLRKLLRQGRRTQDDMWTEAIAQRVHTNFDEGQVLYRERLPIDRYDSPETLQSRLFDVEYRVQIETLRRIANNQFTECLADSPLVRDDELDVLEEAKLAAKMMYPHK